MTARELAQLLGGSAGSGGSYSARCPAHADGTASLSIADGRNGSVVVNCFAGCTYPAILAAIERDHGVNLSAHRERALTLTTLAEYTLLPNEFLADCGLTDHAGGVAIPYRRRDGSLQRTKLRAAIKGRGRFRWLSGGTKGQSPYGLDRLDLRFPPEKPLWLVEGESDCWTLWRHGVDALGIPGANAVGVLEASHLEGVEQLLILREPDAGGGAFVRGIATRLAEIGYKGSASVVSLATEKDPSDLHKRCVANGEDFTTQLTEAVSRAVPLSEAAQAILAPGAGGSSGPAAGFLRLADVQAEPIDWLWPGRIAVGKLTSLEGDPGLGKSTVALDLAARVTTGMPMPLCETWRDPASAIYFTSEDGLSDTVKPRAEAAGADVGRLYVHSAGGLRVPGGIPELERFVIEHDVRLIVFDPLMGFLDGGIDSHKEQDVRGALGPLAEMAQRTGAAILLVRHLKKDNGGPALYRGGGSIGITASVRSGFVVAKDPEDPKSRIVATQKNNLGADSIPALRFHLEPAVVGECKTSRVVYDTECDYTADRLLAPVVVPASVRDDAKAFLSERLGRGAVGALELEQEAKDLRISVSTLKRARDEIGGVSRRIGDRWFWELEGSG